MYPHNRIVTRLPIIELWTESGPLSASRTRPLGSPDIAAMLRITRIRFVIADCGHPLQWLPPDQCFRTWKEDIKPHLTEPATADEGFRLEDYPGHYCYIASEWSMTDHLPIVLLEKYH